jgi:hypothetical protein
MPSSKNLNQLINQLLHFQEEHLGKEAVSPPQLTRLPVSVVESDP